MKFFLASISFVSVLTVCILSAVPNAYAQSMANNEFDFNIFNPHRFGFGVGYSNLTYQESREFQAILNQSKIRVHDPVVYAYWAWWLSHQKFDLTASSQLIGVSARRWDINLGLRWHRYTRETHLFVHGGAYSYLKFEPVDGRGYGLVVGTYLEPGFGFIFSGWTSFPKEFQVIARIAKPVYGGSVSFQKSLEWGGGVQLRLPLKDPKAFPVYYFERMIVLGARYEQATFHFDAVRTVEAIHDRIMITLGYEY